MSTPEGYRIDLTRQEMNELIFAVRLLSELSRRIVESAVALDADFNPKRNVDEIRAALEAGKETLDDLSLDELRALAGGDEK